MRNNLNKTNKIMENFETILVKFNYEGVDYSYYVRGEVVTGDTDTWWDCWITRNNYTFQIVGDMWGDTPIYSNLKVFVYPAGKFEDTDRIAEITKVYSKFAEKKTMTFNDLEVGNIIYVSDRWDLYKLTIAGIGEGSNERGRYKKFTFVDDSEFAYCDTALDIDRVFEVDEEYLDNFSVECYRDCLFFADKDECKEYLEVLQKRTADAIEKVNKTRYSWKYIDENGKESQSKSFETMNECYRAMHKNALLKLDILTCGMEKMWYEIKFETDHITINNNEKRWDWWIVEVK